MALEKTGLTRGLAEIGLSSALYNVGFYLGTSLIILYLVGLGYSPFLAGVLLAASKLIYAAAMMMSGSLSDRIGRKTPIIWGFALTGAGLVAMGLIANLTVEAILLIIVWIGYAFQGPPASAAISDGALLGKTAIAFGWFYMLMSGGQVIGQALAGVTAQGFGYRVTLIGGGVLSLISIVILSRYTDRHKPVKPRLDFYGDLKNGPRLVRSDSGLQNLIFGLSFHSMGFQMFYTYIPLVASQDQHLGDAAIGTLLALFSVGSALSVLVFGVLTARIGGLRMLIWHLALSSLVWWIYPFIPSFGVAVVLMTVMGVIGAMDMPARREILSYIAESEVGTAMGALDSITMSVASVGVLLAGALWNFGHWVPFLASASMNAVGIIFLLRVKVPKK
jgi:DHA1 family multidrug resistance protein-like MFS transporter